ncbi:aldo/keto reductase [Kushneria aurantia]|uniref:Aldo/keto reductase n=1 Tax=Kushneria aurantia TaxID=504092 RepID=A0ABV6G1N2_9GAMM|nr:aldo/keto reductase [Kushneria aurantia]
MNYRKLGNTGLFVSELCLGTMTFGGRGEMWQKIGDLHQADADRLVGRALEAGVNFIDTADVYSQGESEVMTGQALKNLGVARDDVVVATKVFGTTGGDNPHGGPGVNNRGASRYHIMEGVKASLKRLQLEHIDLYQIHGFDPATPIEETVRALHTLVEHGHVRYVGVSNWAAWQIVKALGIARQHGWHRFESLQAYYTLAGRDLERELVPMMASENLGLMVWSPLAGGFLSGKYHRDGETDAANRRASFDFPPVNRERVFDCVEAMAPMAEQRGVSVARIALGWLLHQPAVTSVIVGAKRLEQLDDNLGATEIRLTPEELATLEAVSALPSEYPGWMLTRQGEARREQLAQSGER